MVGRKMEKLHFNSKICFTTQKSHSLNQKIAVTLRKQKQEKNMYQLSKDYQLLYQLIQKQSIVCFVDYDFYRNGKDKARDICQCKITKSKDITFISRGHEYGGVSQWEIELEKTTEYDLFLSECKSLNIEFIPC